MQAPRCDWHLAVVLGHHAYYGKFGFVRASDYGFENEFGADENFMAIELDAGALKGLNGLVTYHAAFRGLGPVYAGDK